MSLPEKMKMSGNIRKSIRWSAVPVPRPRSQCLKLIGRQDSGPKGVDNLCFHTYREFSPSLSVRPSVHLFARGPNPSHETQIPVLWPKSQPHCSCPNGQVTSNIAPAHLHTTEVAMYPALFFKHCHLISFFHLFFKCCKRDNIHTISRYSNHQTK